MSIIQSDALHLPLADESVDAVVCDPPYGIGFMGKEWDSGKSFFERKPDRRNRFDHVGGNHNPIDSADSARTKRVEGQRFQSWCEQWAREAYRVLKPGGHLLAAGSSRTFHRLACGIEDAGFEMRDTITHHFGQGFPKSSSPYRSQMGALCRSHALAPHAVRVSPWHPVESPEVRVPTALSLAETLPVGDLALLIRTGAVGDSSEVTAMLLSDFLTDGTNWNTASSWAGYSAGRWAPVSTSIIEMALETIIASKTLNFSQWTDMPRVTTQDEIRPDGCTCRVVNVENGLNDDGGKPNGILIPIAVEHVITPLAWTQGLGTAAKPATEFWTVARKPLGERTVAGNVQRWGTGAINIAACRVGVNGQRPILDTWERAESLCVSCAGHVAETPRRPIPATGAFTARKLAEPTTNEKEETTQPATSKTAIGCSGGTLADVTSTSSSIGAYGRTPTGQSPTDMSSTTSTTTPWTTGSRTCDSCGAAITPATTPESRAYTQTDPGRQLSTPVSGNENTPSPGRSTPLPNDADVPQGRWPTNCVLTHTPDCVEVGVRKVRSGMAVTKNLTAGAPIEADVYGTYGRVVGPNVGYGGDARLETIPAYECAAGCPVAKLDAQSGTLTSGDLRPHAEATRQGTVYGERPTVRTVTSLGDTGGASRFFPTFRYQAKAPTKERVKVNGVAHPTTKPLELMRWLVRLVTPPGGRVLDPFSGSGTTAEACILEGFECVAIERDSTYLPLIVARVGRQRRAEPVVAPVQRRAEPVVDLAAVPGDIPAEVIRVGQLTLEIAI